MALTEPLAATRNVPSTIVRFAVCVRVTLRPAMSRCATVRLAAFPGRPLPSSAVRSALGQNVRLHSSPCPPLAWTDPAGRRTL